MLQKCDLDHSGFVDFDDFKWCLKNIGIDLNLNELQIVSNLNGNLLVC